MCLWQANVVACLAAVLLCLSIANAAPASLERQVPVEVVRLPDGNVLVDFGKVAFGNVELAAPDGADAEVVVHFGESMSDDRIDRSPPGTVRYQTATATLIGGETAIVAPAADERNTKTDPPPAILTPPEWGVVLPFRWVEIEGWPGDVADLHITRRAAFLADWDDEAATFECSDDALNAIWSLCKYSIKATTFAGLYVDGDRERIPYEADAYLNQISHYYTDGDKQIARDTFDHLMKYPTWPTEWGPHMIFMAHADFLHTSDADWLRPRYEALKEKALLDRVDDTHLVASSERQIEWGDLVDWPPGERDGFVFGKYNTVVNAFHLEALRQLAELAEAVGEDAEAQAFRRQRAVSRAVFNGVFFDFDAGVYVDGLGIEHSAIHANLFPLAFGLVPEAHVEGVVQFLTSKGMDCSVYAAQYLMEALFENGAAEHAMELMLADTNRSWKHMLDSGTTITWEAWDQKYKPNQDWNHAWGAAPANLLPRYVLGVQPAAAGWTEASIAPHPGGLTFARGRVPTIRGPIEVAWEMGERFTLTVDLPPGVTATVSLPRRGDNNRVLVNGRPVEATLVNNRLVLINTVSGTATIELL